MKKIILTESELVSLIKRVVSEAMSDIDFILDKISQGGMESLTDKEKQYLQHYSETGQYMDVEDEEDVNVFGNNEFIGEKFSDVIKDTSVSFVYEMTEDTEKGMIHTGYLTVNQDEYYGEIFCDDQGTFMFANFESSEETDLFEDYYKIQGELEMFLQNVCENLKSDPTT